MSRTASFFIGMLCGMIAFVLIIAIALYCFVAVVTPNQISPQSAQYLGDLANKSLLDIYKELSGLYKSANIVEPDENGEYFSIADFEEKYNIDFSQSLGITLTDEIKKMPVFSLFTGNGIQKLLGQTSITAVSDLMAIFTNKGLLSDSALAKLTGYSVTDIMSQPMTVLKQLSFGDVLGNNEAQTKGLNGGLKDAFMGCNIGETLELLFGGGNLLLAIKSGPLSAIGELTFKEIAGSTANDAIDNLKLADIINDNGSIDPTSFISNKPLGELIGNHRKQLDSATITTTYPTEVGTFVKNESTTYTVRSDKNGNLAMTEDNENWYEAKLKCTSKEETHQHQYDCYTYKWYTSSEYTEEISSMLYSFANLSINELSGDSFTNIVNKMTIREVLGDDAVTSGILKAIADVPLQDLTKTIDTLPLGSALGYERTEVKDTTQYTIAVFNENTTIVKQHKTDTSKYIKSVDGGTVWYEAKFTCQDSSHTHNARCYSHWFNAEDTSPSSYIAVIADLTFKDMTGSDALNNAINDMTFGEVINMDETTSPMLKELSDTKLSDIGSAIDNIYMGTVLNLYRKEITNTSGYTLVSGTENVYKNGSTYAIKYNGKMYEAILTCTTSHTHNTDACYGFQWYNEEGCTTKANAINMKLANKKINELSSDMIADIVSSLTVRELINSGVLDLSQQDQDSIDNIYTYSQDDTEWRDLTVDAFVKDLINKMNNLISKFPTTGSLTTTQTSYLVA